MTRPILEHTSGAWKPHLQKDIRQVERVQRRAARFCCSDYTHRTPGCVDNTLKLLHWENLEARRKHNCLSLLHKIITDHVDLTIDEYLQRSVPELGEPSILVMQMQTTQTLPFIFPCDTLGMRSPKAPPPTHRGFHRWLSCLNNCKQIISS